MELSSLILRNHVDISVFAVVVVLGLVFCQLVVRSAHIGGTLPARNVIATILMTVISAGVTFGVSRLYEAHHRSVLEGAAAGAALDMEQILTSSPGQREVGFSQAVLRWRTAMPSLAGLVLVDRSAPSAPKIVFDGGLDLDGDGAVARPDELPRPAGETPARELHAMPAPTGGGLAPLMRSYSNTPYLQLAAACDSRHFVSLVFRSSTWTIPVAAARLVTLATALCVIALLLSRPCLQCIHNAELARRQKIEAGLQQAREAANAESRMKSELLSALTYEIRTPLTAIMGFSRVLLDSTLDGGQRRHVETIVSAGDRLAGILNDILDLNKIEEGKLQLEEIDYSPISVLNEIIDLMTPQATRKGVALRLETNLRESFTTRGDPVRLRQIVLRLVDNGIRFTDTGAVTVRAGWRATPQGDADGVLALTVQDTGVGIPTDRLAGLFTTLAPQEAQRSRFNGNGLGLVMAKKLVDLMHGTLSASSRPGAGSTFTVDLPCTPKSTITQGPVETVTTPPKVRRALVVDDQALNREIVRLMLQRAGFSADTAASGADALKMAGQQEYDIVFLDLDMPGLDGFETTAKLRALGSVYKHIPIVAVTGVTEKGTREKCLVAGMSEYLPKPVYAPALKSTIAAVMPG